MNILMSKKRKDDGRRRIDQSVKSSNKPAACYHITMQLLLPWHAFPLSSGLPIIDPSFALTAPRTWICCSPSLCHHLIIWTDPSSSTFSFSIFHLPPLTSTVVWDSGKWYSGRKQIVGPSSGVAFSADNLSVNSLSFMSNPYSSTRPCVRMGLGRINASAARYPTTSPETELLLESALVRIGVFVASSMFDGLIVVDSFTSNDFRHSLSVCVAPGRVRSKRVESSSDVIDRSSPFQRSPHSWQFCIDPC